MYIDPTDLECVAFLYAERGGGGAPRRPMGTAFFVELADGFRYLVTARHILEREQGDVFVRLNRMSGEWVFQPAPHDQWAESHDADVAALLFARRPDPRDDLAYKVVPLAHFINSDCCYAGPALTPELRRKGGIPVQLGHDAYFFSLFTPRPGEHRNLPVVRFARISGVPAEPISMEREFEVVGYVAESLSWGGHSGSPVFWVSAPQVAQGKLRNGSEAIAVGSLRGLLGLISGHFDIPVKPETMTQGGVSGKLGEGLEAMRVRLNAGLAVITPAEDIRQLLMREDVVKKRGGAQ